MKFVGSVEVAKGVFVDRVQPRCSPRGFNHGDRPPVTAVLDGEVIRLSTGQCFHVSSARIDYWVEA